RGTEGGKRQRVLRHGEELREEPDAARGLAARAFELIVEGRVLELLQVERGGVFHEQHARTIGEEVAEETLDERADAREHFTGDDDEDLHRDELPETREMR